MVTLPPVGDPAVKRALQDAFGNHGTADVVPDSDGNAVIAHGLAGTPIVDALHIVGDVTSIATAQAVDQTNITVRIASLTDGSDVSGGTFTVHWGARLP